MDYILQKINELNADGVDFFPLSAILEENFSPSKILESYTKDEWTKDNHGFIKTPYMFWKMVNGKKEYCDITK